MARIEPPKSSSNHYRERAKTQAIHLSTALATIALLGSVLLVVYAHKGKPAGLERIAKALRAHDLAYTYVIASTSWLGLSLIFIPTVRRRVPSRQRDDSNEVKRATGTTANAKQGGTEGARGEKRTPGDTGSRATLRGAIQLNNQKKEQKIADARAKCEANPNLYVRLDSLLCIAYVDKNGETQTKMCEDRDAKENFCAQLKTQDYKDYYEVVADLKVRAKNQFDAEDSEEIKCISFPFGEKHLMVFYQSSGSEKIKRALVVKDDSHLKAFRKEVLDAAGSDTSSSVDSLSEEEAEYPAYTIEQGDAAMDKCTAAWEIFVPFATHVAFSKKKQGNANEVAPATHRFKSVDKVNEFCDGLKRDGYVNYRTQTAAWKEQARHLFSEKNLPCYIAFDLKGAKYVLYKGKEDPSIKTAFLQPFRFDAFKSTHMDGYTELKIDSLNSASSDT